MRSAGSALQRVSPTNSGLFADCWGGWADGQQLRKGPRSEQSAGEACCLCSLLTQFQLASETRAHRRVPRTQAPDRGPEEA